MRRLLFFVVWGFMAALVPAESNAQLTSATSLFFEDAPYQSSPNQDVVFYFDGTSSITLKATAPNGNASTFTWRKYSPGGWQFLSSATGTSDELTGLDEGGYEVTISDGTTSNVYRCWAFVPSITGTPTVEVIAHDCYSLSLACSGFSTKTLTCVDFQSGALSIIKYDLQFQWLANGTEVETSATATNDLDAPYNDADYSVSLSSKFVFLGNSTSLPVNVMAKAVKADFEYKIVKNEVDNEYNTEAEGSAPLRVEFYGAPDGTQNRSQGNITAYTWEFGTAGKDFVPNPSFVFLTKKNYPVTLTVENQASGCVSTSEATNFNVIDLFLDVPNFFTPTGDGVHDEFRVAYSSVKEFKMVIINRWGRVVYESTNPEKGWDGNINGKHAAPGVYFYDVVAKGFSKGEQKHMKGFLHLVRKEK